MKERNLCRVSIHFSVYACSVRTSLEVLRSSLVFLNVYLLNIRLGECTREVGKKDV